MKAEKYAPLRVLRASLRTLHEIAVRTNSAPVHSPLCGAVAAETTGIESQNVVGYQTVNSRAGFNFYAPMFRKVDGTKTKISDIRLGEGATPYADNIQVLDEDGATVGTYIYVTEDAGLGSDGWTEDFTTLADVALEKGQSVIVHTTAKDVPITYAGEVDKSVTKITSVAGFNFVGNNVPRTIKIQDIKLGEGAMPYGDNIQILNEDGVPVNTYIYVTEDAGLGSDGWTEDFTTLADVTLEPGQGIIVQTASAGVEITLPGAL